MTFLSLLSAISVSLVPAVDDGRQTHDGEEKESSPNGCPYEGEKNVCLSVVVSGGWESDSDDAGLDIIGAEGHQRYLSQWETYQVCKAAHHHHFLPVVFSISRAIQCHRGQEPTTIHCCSIKTEIQCQKYSDFLLLLRLYQSRYFARCT